MVFANAYISTWKYVCTALTDNNRAETYCGAVIYLYAEVFWAGVTPVFCCSCRLFRCHSDKEYTRRPLKRQILRRFYDDLDH